MLLSAMSLIMTKTKVAEQAEYYEKALAVVPNFYVQKTWVRSIFEIRN